MGAQQASGMSSCLWGTKGHVAARTWAYWLRLGLLDDSGQQWSSAEKDLAFECLYSSSLKS